MRASDKAYAALRDDIIEWRLLPGTVLAEVEQSERLGISRTPLREALSRLTAEGLTTARRPRRRRDRHFPRGHRRTVRTARNPRGQGRRAGRRARRRRRPSMQLRRELLQAPELIGGADPALHDYYGLVGRLDAAIDAAISNAYLAQAMRSLRVHLVRVRRLAADDAARLTRRRRRARRHRRSDRRRQPAAGRGRHHAAPAPQPFPRQSHAYTSLQGAPWLRNTTSASTRARKTCPARTSSPTRSPRSPPTLWRSTDEVTDMVINRIIDNASVAIASLNRGPVVAARAQALTHGPDHRRQGRHASSASTSAVSPEWAAWANGVAVRELDYHDTFLAAEYSHPGDNIPPILAVAQHVGASGTDLIRGIATGYEIQVDLVKAICLHKHKIDHVAHLGPSAAAGIGTLLGLDVETIFQSVGQALHTTTATRQSRKGEISTWKAHAPAFAGKMAVEAVDRAMRGQTSPCRSTRAKTASSPGCSTARTPPTRSRCPSAGEAKRAILDTYTKEHSAEYQAQAWIDLARKLHSEHPEVTRPGQRRTSVLIKTSHHTHYVIGSGANDPQKYDPTASRETLDHSIPYIFTVALQDGAWHHVDSYAPERAGRPDTVELWHKVTTVEDPEWTRRYHSLDIAEKAFGGSRGDHPGRRHGHRRRDRRRRRPPARRPAVRPGAVHRQVPHPRRRPGRPTTRSNASSPPPQRLPELARRRAGPAEHPGGRPA